MSYQVHNEDCLAGMANLAENSIDAIVTDPPYGLSFMGKGWDHGIPGEDYWRAAIRCAKPGAYLLAFGGTRTHHRLTCAIEDAGWEIRDCIMWVYGSGFPKSLDVSKAIDKAAGAEREVTGKYGGCGIKSGGGSKRLGATSNYTDTAFSGERRDTATTDAAKQWQGWGTALKPAFEPIILARKPLIGTVAANVQEFGTGAMNIDASRIATDPSVDDPRLGGNGTWGTENAAKNVYEGGYAGERVSSSSLGRWPANFIHDGSDEVLELFPQTGASGKVRGNEPSAASNGNITGHRERVPGAFHGDAGSAARFFYAAKASKADRDEGMDNAPDRLMAASNQAQAQLKRGEDQKGTSGVNTIKVRKNNHPTVKPTALMRYLCKLVTPTNGLILDPFTGSGSTGKAALLEGFRFVGFELEAEYAAIARARCAAVANQTPLLEAV